MRHEFKIIETVQHEQKSTVYVDAKDYGTARSKALKGEFEREKTPEVDLESEFVVKRKVSDLVDKNTSHLYVDLLYYVLFIYGDVEPEMFGPFDTREDRNKYAQHLRYEHGDDHGIYPLDAPRGTNPLVGTFNGSLFEE